MLPNLIAGWLWKRQLCKFGFVKDSFFIFSGVIIDWYVSTIANRLSRMSSSVLNRLFLFFKLVVAEVNFLNFAFKH